MQFPPFNGIDTGPELSRPPVLMVFWAVQMASSFCSLTRSVCVHIRPHKENALPVSTRLAECYIRYDGYALGIKHKGDRIHTTAHR